MDIVCSIRAYFAELAASERFSEEESCNVFASGEHSCLPISSAKLIAERFSGRVFGYWSRDSDAYLPGESWEGIDFALIQSRWLVDMWSNRIAEISPYDVLDLQDEVQASIVSRCYGNQLEWELVHDFEASEG